MILSYRSCCPSAPVASALSHYKNIAFPPNLPTVFASIVLSEYIYDMELALNAADLIIARSGGSVSEMTALGKAAILIPSPYVAGNHQEHNADMFVESGCSVKISESELTKE